MSVSAWDFSDIIPSLSLWSLSLCPKAQFLQNFQTHFQILLVHPKDQKMDKHHPTLSSFSTEKEELPNFGEKPGVKYAIANGGLPAAT